MRRTGVWVSVFRNSVIHEILSEFLQPFRYVGTQRVSPFYRGFLFIWFLGFVGLDFIRLPRSTINRNRHWHWRNVTVSRIFPFSNLNFIYCRWRRWGWRRWWRMTLMFHRCPWSWWRYREELDKPGTTIGTKFSVLQIIRIPSLMRCGFWPLIHS